MIRPLLALVLLAQLIPFAIPAHAAPPSGLAAGFAPAIAMHGEPAYAPGFDHFDYVNPAAPKGGTLRRAVTGGFDSLNPFIVKGVPAVGLTYVFETLMARSWNEPFALYGLLADGLAVPPDRSSATFHLNPAARWHDGTPVTAADVLFSFQAQREHGTPNRRQFYAKVTEASALDDRTIRFTFAPGPDGDYDREMPLLMGLMPVLSKAWWSGRDFSVTTLDPPMGSGPYRIETVEPGRRITYRRVPDYWGRDIPSRKGMFNFDRMDFSYFRDDTVALEAFKAGQADVRYESEPGVWATGYDGPALRDGRIVLEELPHHRPDFTRGFVFNTRRPPFDDIRVREALGLATDFVWMNKTLFHGALTRTASWFPNSELAATGLPGSDELAVLAPFRDRLPKDLFTKPFTLPKTDGSGPFGLRANLRKALALLDAAGWHIRDGRLENAERRPLTFEILVCLPTDERVALVYARSLERLGIAVRVRPVDSAQYQLRLNNFDYDMIIGWWLNSLSPGNEQLFYVGSAAAGTTATRNYPGIRDPVVDAIAASIAKAVTRAELVARVRALDRVLLWGHYMVPLFHSTADRVARWSWVKRPAVTALYGPLVDAWWAGKP